MPFGFFHRCMMLSLINMYQTPNLGFISLLFYTYYFDLTDLNFETCNISYKNVKLESEDRSFSGLCSFAEILMSFQVNSQKLQVPQNVEFEQAITM